MRTVFVCGLCGSEKFIANHWFVVDFPKGAMFSVYQWDPHRIISNDDALAICGQMCLMKLVNQKAGAAGA